MKIQLYKGKKELKGWVFVAHGGNNMLAVCKEDELPESIDGLGEMILQALAMEHYLDLKVSPERVH